MSANVDSNQIERPIEIDYPDSPASSTESVEKSTDLSNNTQVEPNNETSSDDSSIDEPEDIMSVHLIEPALNPSEINYQGSSASSNYPRISPLDQNKVIIGPKGTLMDRNSLSKINWRNSASKIVRQMLMQLFGSATLATHNLFHKPSPAFADFIMPETKFLNANIVADITHLVMDKCKGSTPREIRVAITTKCADEAKRLKKREGMLLKTKKSDKHRAKPY